MVNNMQDTTGDSEQGITRYKYEYSGFLEYVKQGKVESAIIYAKVLQIDRRTLVHWLKQPELRDAMLLSIDTIVEGMKKAGKGDWRMYRELLKLLGVDVEQSAEIASSGGAQYKPFNIIVESAYERKPNFRIDNEVANSGPTIIVDKPYPKPQFRTDSEPADNGYTMIIDGRDNAEPLFRTDND